MICYYSNMHWLSGIILLSIYVSYLQKALHRLYKDHYMKKKNKNTSSRKAAQLSA